MESVQNKKNVANTMNTKNGQAKGADDVEQVSHGRDGIVEQVSHGPGDAGPQTQNDTGPSPQIKAGPNPVLAFLKRKDIEFSVQRYLYDAFSALALGLFASLLIGTILNTAGTLSGIGFLVEAGDFAKAAAGAAMAVAVGYALKSPPLVLFSLVVVGVATNDLGGPAGAPLAIFFIAIITAEIGKIVSKETPIDLLATPLVTVLVGISLAWFLAPPISTAASWVGNLVMIATELQPLLSGAVVGLVIGVALTLPISSAAICASFGLTGLAGGAAVAGCCAQMVGFAITSFKENRWGGLVSQGLGTSMLQVPNIIRNPRIWIPTMVASAMNGALAAGVLGLKMDGPAIASGMGTCGLVGPLGVYTGWVDQMTAGLRSEILPFDWISLLLVSIVVPILVSVPLTMLLRRIGWIKKDDMLLRPLESAGK